MTIRSPVVFGDFSESSPPSGREYWPPIARKARKVPTENDNVVLFVICAVRPLTVSAPGTTGAQKTRGFC